MTRNTLLLTAGALFMTAEPTSAQSICDGCTLSVTGAEAPTPQLWTQPSAFSQVESSDEGQDRRTIDLAARLSRGVGAYSGDWTLDSWFVRAVANVSDQAKKQQENYAAQIGVKLDWNPTTARYRGRIQDLSEAERDAARYAIGTAWSAFVDAHIGLNSKATFANLSAEPCLGSPNLPQCGTQDQTSVTVALDIQPYHCSFEAACPRGPGREVLQSEEDTQWSVAFSPRARFFYDEVTEAVLNSEGRREEGGVAGARVTLDLAVSPPVLDNRLVFRVGVQHVRAFSRSDLRAERFPGESELLVASMDVELGHRSTEPGPGWVPSVGIAYSDGEDPLTGRSDRRDTTYAFRLTYKSE